MQSPVSIHEPDGSSLMADNSRIILIEDDPALRNSVADYLTRIGYDVTSVESGLRFYHAMAEQTFAAAIIDLGLPDIDGLQLVEYVRKNTTMHCIILTARGSVDARIAGYDSRAELYLVKPVDCRELAAALASMLQRKIEGGFASDEQCWRLNRQSAALVTPAAALVSLTSRELDFLICLAESQEEAVPRSTILDTLGYRDDDFSNRALESLIRRLRRKIEAIVGSSPILTRHGVGYSFSAPLALN
jgi:DNA-binding response OmpR family regulator